MELKPITLKVNDRDHVIAVKPHWTLAEVLRDRLNLTGAKVACGQGACGSCTVIVDGRAVPSCLMLAVEQEGRNIYTIEGLSRDGELHPLQEAWMEEYAAQCGFCSPGMIMSAKALLDENSAPSVDDIKEALSGNICICSNYDHIIAAVKKAAQRLDGRL
jgi:carbon-monoxide dehydrogenase small subunit